MKVSLRHAYPGDEAAAYGNRRLRQEELEALAEIREILMRELSNANSGQHAVIRVLPSRRRRSTEPVSNSERGRLDAVDDVMLGQIAANLPVQSASAPPTAVILTANVSPDARQVGDIGPGQTNHYSPRQLNDDNEPRGHLDAVDDVVSGQIVADLPVQSASAPTTAVILTVNGSPDTRQVGGIGNGPTNQNSPRQLRDDNEPGHVADAYTSREIALCIYGTVCLLMLLITLGGIVVYSIITRREKKMG
ncbi:hypothetical protein MTO96_044090 [Rhipicephalus appendiculatus]